MRLYVVLCAFVYCSLSFLFLLTFIFPLFMIRMTSVKEGRNQGSPRRGRWPLCDLSHLQLWISHNKENEEKGKVRRTRAVCKPILQLPAPRPPTGGVLSSEYLGFKTKESELKNRKVVLAFSKFPKMVSAAVALM